MKKATTILISALLASAAAHTAQAASARLEIKPEIVQIGEAASLRLIVEGRLKAPAPNLPEVEGLRMQPAGTETQLSFGTGGRVQTIVHKYAVIPLRAGDFEIGPFAYRAGNETFNLPSVQLKVVGGNQDQPEEKAQSWSDLLFARIYAEPETVYSGQTFDLYLDLYFQRLNIGRDIGLLNLPDEGLSIQPFQELQAGRKAVNGTVYEVRRFRSRVRALTAGSFTIDPQLRVPVRVPRKRRSHSIFDDPFFDFGGSLFGGAYETHRVDIQPEPARIEVRPLPDEGRPASFAGAVGRFDADVTLQPDDVQAGDPVTLRVRIVGEGNIDSVSLSGLTNSAAFKTYDMKLLSKNLSDGGGRGELVFEQVLIPKSSEITDVPALEFSYFDPKAQSYRVVNPGPLPLTVRAATNRSVSLTLSSGFSEPSGDPEILGEDIVYLKPRPAAWRKTAPHARWTRPGRLAVHLLPAFILAAVWQWTRRREYLDRNTAAARRIEAPRHARRELARADEAQRRGDTAAFFEHLHGAVRDYFGHRLNLAPGDVSVERMVEALHRAGMEPDTVEFMRSLIARCEAVRFGGGIERADDQTADEERLVSELKNILRNCERKKW